MSRKSHKRPEFREAHKSKNPIIYICYLANSFISSPREHNVTQKNMKKNKKNKLS